MNKPIASTSHTLAALVASAALATRVRRLLRRRERRGGHHGPRGRRQPLLVRRRQACLRQQHGHRHARRERLRGPPGTSRARRWARSRRRCATPARAPRRPPASAMIAHPTLDVALVRASPTPMTAANRSCYPHPARRRARQQRVAELLRLRRDRRRRAAQRPPSPSRTAATASRSPVAARAEGRGDLRRSLLHRHPRRQRRTADRRHRLARRLVGHRVERRRRHGRRSAGLDRPVGRRHDPPDPGARGPVRLQRPQPPQRQADGGRRRQPPADRRGEPVPRDLVRAQLQQWYYEYTSYPWMRLVSAQSGKCLDVNASNQLMQQTCSGATTQLSSTAAVHRQHLRPGVLARGPLRQRPRLLDGRRGPRLQTYPCNGGTNQQWYFGIH